MGALPKLRIDWDQNNLRYPILNCQLASVSILKLLLLNLLKTWQIKVPPQFLKKEEMSRQSIIFYNTKRFISHTAKISGSLFGSLISS